MSSRHNIPWHLMHELEQASRNEPTLKELHFFNRGLREDDCEAVAWALSCNTVVTYLDMGKNAIGDKGVAHLARSGCLTRLSTLLLSDNCMSLSGMSEVCAAASKSSSLTHLDLSDNVLGSAAVPVVSQLIASCSSLASLQLQYTELGMHCAAAFAQGLNKAPQLKQLGLGGCLLMSPGANTFADFLRRNTTLEHLNLDCNAILDEGVRSVCEALCHNTTLCALKIGNNSMTSESVESVAKLLSMNKTLRGLYISGTHGFNAAVDLKGTQIIGRALAASPRIRPFELLGCNLCHVAAEMGIPQCIQMDNQHILGVFVASWRKMLLAFAMGMHQRLGGPDGRQGHSGAGKGIERAVGGSLVFVLNHSLIEMIAFCYWGQA